MSFLGKSAGFSATLNLSTLDGEEGFVINGIDSADYSGGSVSSAGDVNGDGFDDLVIGAFKADQAGGSDAGESYVIFGSINGPGNVITTSAGTGTAIAESFVGSAGDDTFSAVAADDSVSSGAGDDSIGVTGNDFFTIDGGSGEDTLSLDVDLDLTAVGSNNKVSGIEKIDLGDGNGSQTLTLDLDDVFDLTDARDISDETTALRILGDSNDSVDLTDFSDAGSEHTIDTIVFDLYSHDTVANADILVEQAVSVV